MKKTKILVSLLLVICLLSTIVLAACNEPVDELAIDNLTYTQDTQLRMATGYNGEKTGLFYAASNNVGAKLLEGTAGEFQIAANQLKPTWKEMESRLNVKFVNKYSGASSAAAEYTNWENKLDEVDMVSGSATLLQEAGVNKKVVNLANYLDFMPNFKAYLDANPIVRLSITGATSGKDAGAIYFSPYFDGVADIERMPLMRIDWVKQLLDGEDDFENTTDTKTQSSVFYNSQYLPATSNVSILSLKADGSDTQTIVKNYAAAKAYYNLAKGGSTNGKYGWSLSSGSIVEAMNKFISEGAKTGAELVNFFREWIDIVYTSTTAGTTTTVYEKTHRSNLFVGYDAAWDADELVALLRCVCACPKLLSGNNNLEAITGIFARENNTQRNVDLTRLAGHLFGVRGMESRKDYLYFDSEGELHDARLDSASYEAMNRMYLLAKEGLVTPMTSDTKSEAYIKTSIGFMAYDYSQTQTLNSPNIGLGADQQPLTAYTAVINPAAVWYSGENLDAFGNDLGTYMRFTESWRSVKTDGWAISYDGVKGDLNRLKAALALIDYAYTERGMILLSYGPDAFIAKSSDTTAANNNGKYGFEWFKFNGEWAPVISADTLIDLNKGDNGWTVPNGTGGTKTVTGTKGNYTDFARQYLGSTLSFVKMQAFEYQCTNAAGRDGAGKVSAAIGKGVLKHPELDVVTTNMWYTSIPTTLPLTKNESDQINRMDAFKSQSSSFSQESGTDKYCRYVQLIKVGFGGADRTTVFGGNGSLIAISANTSTSLGGWGGQTYISIMADSWSRLIEYFNATK